MKSIYYREQKHICGKSYATAPYMEVDLYPVTPKQHKASRRAKRKEASTLAQQTYNDNRAKRYHVQLVNANFGKGDFSWTGTYDDDHHPEPGDMAKADRDLTNYIKRLYRWCDKNGVQRPKWVAATEYCTVQEDGTACGRHHHHAIIQHTDGLTRDVLEQLWADKAGQIGFTRCEYLDVDHGSVESLVRYISKNKRCARSWRQSRGLEKPKTPPPNDTKWSRKKLDEANAGESWQRRAEPMKNQEKRPCPLCERHQRMETTSGMLFWVEWGEDGNPRLCTDTLHDGGGLNVLCIDFCPLCGREMEKQEALG